MAMSIKVSVISATIALVGSFGCGHSTPDASGLSAEAGATAPVAANTMDAAAPLADQPTSMATDAGVRAVAMSSGAGVQGVLTDAQIVAIVTAANSGELDQANAVLAKLTSEKAKTFAQHMVKDHTKAGKELADVAAKDSIAPEANDTSRLLERNGKALLTRLQAMPAGGDLDREYMDAQVKEHQELLTELDTHLIPWAKDEQLTTLLKKVRTKVADHLKMAQNIESALRS
jgi:putative membrane protein